MAVFLEQFTGANGAPWSTERWQDVGASGNGAVDIQSNRGRMLTHTTNVYGECWARGILPPVADFVLTGTFQVGSTAEQYPFIGVRVSDDEIAGPELEDGYAVELGISWGDIALVRYDGGTPTEIGYQDGITWTTGLYAWEILCQGATIEVRIWLASGSRPATPTVSATDATYESGGIALAMTGGNDTGPRTCYWDDVTVDVTTEATGSVTLPVLEVAGAGTVESAAIEGAGDVTLPALTASGTGSVDVEGSGATTLPGIAASAAGSVDVMAEGAASLPGIGAEGAGSVEVRATAQASLPALGAGAAGTVDVEGAGTVSLPGLAVSGSGAIDVTGTGAAELPVIEVEGRVGSGSLATGDVLLPGLAAGGSVRVEVQGAGQAALPGCIVGGTGVVLVSGSAAVALPLLVIQGTDRAPREAVGSVTLPAMLVSGEGRVASELRPYRVLLSVASPRPTVIVESRVPALSASTTPAGLSVTTRKASLTVEDG